MKDLLQALFDLLAGNTQSSPFRRTPATENLEELT
jgi:hypothetical protein